MWTLLGVAAHIHRVISSVDVWSLLGKSSSTFQVSIGCPGSSEVSYLLLVMAHQGLEDTFFESNQPREFVHINERLAHIKTFMNDFKPNLSALRVEQTCALNLPVEDLSPDILISLITKTLLNWSGPKTHDFHEISSLKNIISSLVASRQTGPGLDFAVPRARDVLLAINTNWGSVKALHVSEDMQKLDCNVAPLPVRVFQNSRPRFQPFHTRSRGRFRGYRRSPYFP